MKRRYTFIAAVVALSLSAGAALAATGKIETAKKPPLTMQFEAVTKHLAATKPFESKQKVFVKGDKRRIEMLPSPGAPLSTKSFSITTGKATVWWREGDKTALRTQMPRLRSWLFLNDRPDLKQRAKKVGSEKLNGMQCDVYLLQPRGPQPPGQPGPRGPWGQRSPRKIWIWTKYGLVVKQVTMGQDKKPLVVSEARNIVVGKPLADSLFQVPKGITVKDAPQGMRGFGRRPGPQGQRGPR